MAEIKVRGYVNHPKTREGRNGKFSTFSLSESYKDKNGNKTYGFYNVTNWNAPEPPPDGSFVNLTGWFKQVPYEKEGVKKTSCEITATKIEVSPPKNSDETKINADPWEV